MTSGACDRNIYNQAYATIREREREREREQEKKWHAI